MHQYLIYGLRDSHTGDIRYVGRSSSGLSRPSRHLQKSVLLNDDSHKGNWLRKVAGEVDVVVLEETSAEKIAEREIWWIAHGREQGWPLTNMTDGGEGGHSGATLTVEHRAKISAANKGRKHTPKQREKFLGSISSRDPRASKENAGKARTAWSGSQHTEEAKAKIAAGNKKPKHTTSSKEKLALSKAKPFVCVETGNIYTFRGEAADDLDLCKRSIGLVLRGKFKQTRGYSFEFVR